MDWRRILLRNEQSGPPLLPPLLRFAMAALWCAASFWAAGGVYSLFPQRNLLPDLLFRVLACALVIAGFYFFLRVLDLNFHPLPEALALPLDRTAARPRAW